jgi:hypothetical protein
VFLQLDEDKVEVAKVLRPRQAINENVVEENKGKPSQEGEQHVVHQGLEGRGSVCQAEQHDKELEEPLVCLEHRLLNVGRVHAYLVVAETEVELGEELDAAEFIEQFLNDENQKLVPYRGNVQGMVVDAKPLGAITLLDEEHRRDEHRRAKPNDPLS